MPICTRKFGIKPLLTLLLTPLACLALAVPAVAETPLTGPDPVVHSDPNVESIALQQQRIKCEEIWKSGKAEAMAKIKNIKQSIEQNGDPMGTQGTQLREQQEELAPRAGVTGLL